MINPRISAVWSSTKPIAPFSCTPRVQEVHTKSEVIHLTPGLLGLVVLFNCQDRKCIAKHIINPRISALWSTIKPIAPFSSTPYVQEVHTKTGRTPYPWSPRLRSIIQLSRIGNVLRKK